MDFTTIVVLVIVAAVAYTFYKAFSKKETVAEVAPAPAVEAAPAVETAPAVKKAPAKKAPATTTAKKAPAKKTTARKPKAQ